MAQKPQSAAFSVLETYPTNLVESLCRAARWRDPLTGMILTLIVHMWCVKRPYMPAPPDSLAGAIYYVCGSPILRDFERLSTLSTTERSRRIEGAARMYRFGRITGVLGKRRLGIDYGEGEEGVRMRSLAVANFRVGRKTKPRWYSSVEGRGINRVP